MIIRCERCSTVYELDETLLAAEGSPVQCAKCQAIFQAVAPKPGAATVLAAPPIGPPAALAKATGEAVTEPAVALAGPVTPRRPPPGPNIYRRPQPQPKPAPPVRGRGRASAPARDAVSAIEARLRRVGRWKLALIPVVAVVVAVIGYAGWAVWKRLPDDESQRQRTEAMALISLDDAASIERAIALLDNVPPGDLASRGAAGERALARALLVAALAEEVEPLVERLVAASSERARLEREQPPGAGDGLRSITVETARVEVELAPRRKQLEALRSRTAQELKAVAAESRGAGDAARGQAVLAVLDGNAEEVQRATTRLRAAGPDHWADLADLWLAIRKDGASRDQAIPRLVALAGAHPQLIRARFVLARALLEAGRREEAISAVTLLLSANPHHERAQRLRAQLATTPARQAAPAAAPVLPPVKQAWAPRAAPPPAAAVNAPSVPVATPPPAAVNLPVVAPPAPVMLPPPNEPAPAAPPLPTQPAPAPQAPPASRTVPKPADPPEPPDPTRG